MSFFPHPCPACPSRSLTPPRPPCRFVTLFICGFLALQAHADTFLTVVELTARGSSFPCFQGKDVDDILAKLRQRFAATQSREETVVGILNLIKAAYQSYGTVQYDKFQNLTQGIAL